MPEQQNIEYKSSWHDDYLPEPGLAERDGGFLVTLLGANVGNGSGRAWKGNT